MSLKNNFTFREGRFTVHYIARHTRLQIYLGRTDPDSGNYDEFWQHLTERQVELINRAEARTLLTQICEAEDLDAEADYIERECA